VPRIPYADLDADDATRAIAASASWSRGGKVLNLYRMLLNEPSLADSWLRLGTHLRYHGRLDHLTRELAICLVATRTSSTYELHHHAPIAIAAGAPAHQVESLGTWSAEPRWTQRQRAMFAFVDAVVAGEVTDPQLAEVARHWDKAEVVELAALTSYYLAVSRFLQATGVETEDD
jgi:alkylhydroperoxidase family enzyme